MKYLLVSLSLLLSLTLSANDVDSILNELDNVLERRDTHFMKREYRIDSLRMELAQGNPNNVNLRYDVYGKIFDEYKSYQSDSSLAYAKRLYATAELIGTPEAMVRAQSSLIFSYISAGVFTDAIDVVKQVDLSKVSDEIKGNFYFLCIRLYSDMSNFVDKSFSDKNATLSHAYSDSVMVYLPAETYEAQYASIFKTMSQMTVDEKISVFTKLLLRNDIDLGEKAMISSILADLYLEKGDKNNTMYFKAQSAIQDVLSAKHETTSKRDLAFLVYEAGDVDRASRYIGAALEDANFYNARHRKMEISSVLPIIEQARYIQVNKEKTILWWAFAFIATLLVGLAIMWWRNIKQTRQLAESHRTIEQRNAEIEAANNQIAEHNNQLKETNAKLRESVKIKDEYIGYGFYLNSEYIRKMESLYKLVNRKLVARQYDDLKMSLKESDLRKEKEVMQREFDRIFLRLFPTFIDSYNALFAPDDQPSDFDGKTLTSEMRIFALIRLGITDCGNIASFLNYSVNTVNTYKTKAKNRSVVPNDQFESKIMEIRSIS